MMFCSKLDALHHRVMRDPAELHHAHHPVGSDLAQDPGELLRERALASPRETWAAPEVGWQLVLASPLSGLVPWAEPPRASGGDEQRQPD